MGILDAPGYSRAAAQAAFAPVDAAVTFINHGSDPNVSRGTAPGRRMWIGDVLPAAFIAGTDLLVKPVRTAVPVPPSGLTARFVAEEAGFVNGATVTSWGALTGNYSLTAGGAPVYTFANGKGYVETDGVDDYLQDATLDRTQPNTLVMVARYKTVANGKYLFATVTGNPNQQSVAIGGTGLRQMYAGSGAAVFGTTENTAWHVYIATFNGTTSELMVNGTVDASGDAKTNPADGLRLAASPALDNFGSLQISEVLAYNRVLTSAEKTSLTTTLRSQYGF